MSRRGSGTTPIDATRTDRLHAAERRIGRVTHALDELVTLPGTSIRVGLDPIVGVIPVVGDAVAAGVGIWVIAEAARFGIPRVVLARMALNLLADLGIGAVPIIGDLYDITLRSNTRNLTLFRRHALDPDASTTGLQAFFAGVVLLVLGLAWLLVVALGAAIGWLGSIRI